MFHHFHGDHEKPMGQGSITGDQFDQIVQAIGVENILDPIDWMEKFSQATLKPNETCITFDDALLGQYDYALPILNYYGIKAFWFVYSSVFEGKLEVLEVYRHFRNRYFSDFDDFYESFFNECNSQFPGVGEIVDDLDPDHIEFVRAKYPVYSKEDIIFRLLRDEHLTHIQYCSVMDKLMSKKNLTRQSLGKGLWLHNKHLKKLAQEGHVVGLHGYDHPTTMAKLSREVQLDQYQRNMDHLEDVTGIRPTTMAHPNNSFCGATLELLRDLEIQLGFRSNVDNCVRPENPDFNLLVPRIDHSRLL